MRRRAGAGLRSGRSGVPLAGAALALRPETALAHGDIASSGSFMSGALHPFLAIEHLLLLLGLGLLMGLLPSEGRGRSVASLLLGVAGGLAGGVAGGLAGGAFGGPTAAIPLAISALTLVAGLLLALAWRPRALPFAALIALAGLAVGLDTDLPAGTAALLIPALGVATGVLVIALDAAALSAWAVRPPLPVVRRVAGSWIAAVAIMLFAFGLVGGRVAP